MKRRVLEIVRDNQSKLHPGDVYRELSNGKKIKDAIEHLLDLDLLKTNENGTLKTIEQPKHDEGYLTDYNKDTK